MIALLIRRYLTFWTLRKKKKFLKILISETKKLPEDIIYWLVRRLNLCVMVRIGTSHYLKILCVFLKFTRYSYTSRDVAFNTKIWSFVLISIAKSYSVINIKWSYFFFFLLYYRWNDTLEGILIFLSFMQGWTWLSCFWL